MHAANAPIGPITHADILEDFKEEEEEADEQEQPPSRKVPLYVY